MENLLPSAQAYRKTLLEQLLPLPSAQRRELDESAKTTLPYKIARHLTHPSENSNNQIPGKDIQRREAHRNNGYYFSNEDLHELSLHGLGGVGIAVGPDQGLDFLIMADLAQVYIVDVDAYTQTTTRMYLELGRRLHHALGRIPTTDEYQACFSQDMYPLTIELLTDERLGKAFQASEVTWMKEKIFENKKGLHISNRLRFKNKEYKDSWIGSNEALERVIHAYENGDIQLVHGDVTGTAIDQIGQRVREQQRTVSFIYTSNATIRTEQNLRHFKQLPLQSNAIAIFTKFTTRDQTPLEQAHDILPWDIVSFPIANTQFWPES